MVAVMLLWLVGGIALSQAVSDPHAVTLRWLRLGGINAVTLAAVALAVVLMTGGGVRDTLTVACIMAVVLAGAQLTMVQLAMRQAQRITAGVLFVVVTAMVGWSLTEAAGDSAATMYREVAVTWWQVVVTSALSAGMLGGFLMAMLLGHAYLTAGGEMTQQPFQRLTWTLAVLLILRSMSSLTMGFVPWWRAAAEQGFEGFDASWSAMMIGARLFVGIVVPGVFLYMVSACVRTRANQSATGILYVAGVLVIIGEGAALSLLQSTGFAF